VLKVLKQGFGSKSQKGVHLSKKMLRQRQKPTRFQMTAVVGGKKKSTTALDSELNQRDFEGCEGTESTLQGQEELKKKNKNLARRGILFGRAKGTRGVTKEKGGLTSDL